MQYVHIGGKTMFLMLFGKNKILERERGREENLCFWFSSDNCLGLCCVRLEVFD